MRTNCLPLIDTGISGMGVLRRHLPEGVLDDDRRIVAYTQFQKENALPTSGAEKVLIPPTALCQPSENSGLHWFGIFEVFTLQEYIDLTLFSIADYIDAVNNDL